jgi:serine/threonine-protein kinase
VGFVVGAAGIVGVGVGSYFGVAAISSKNDGAAHCSGKFCDAQGLSDENDAHTKATVSTVAFAVGAVALAAGAYLVLAAPSKSAAQLRLAPVVLARGSGAAAEVIW